MNKILSIFICIGLCASSAVLIFIGYNNRELTAQLFSKSSYYVMWLLFIIWGSCFFIWKKHSGFSFAKVAADHWKGILFCLIVSSILFISCPPHFRVLSDETNLLAVSKSMVEDRTIDNVTMGKWYYFNFNPFNREIPYRPFVYPFLVHILHVIFGYQPAHAFAVNFFLLFAILTLIFIQCTGVAGKTAGYIAVTLSAAQPALTITATSAGFDLTFVFFLFICFAALRTYLIKPSAPALSWLWWNLIVLANIRYESVLFFFITFLGLILFKKLKSEHLNPLWLYCLTPLILTNRIWQQLLIKKLRDYLQTPESSSTFSLSNLTEHTKLFIQSLTRFDFFLPYANLINWIGCIGLIYLTAGMIRPQNQTDKTNKALFFISAACLTAYWIVINAFHMGDLTHPASVRYYVPFYLIISIFAAFLLCHFTFSKQKPFIAALLALFLFSIYHTASAENRFMNALFLPREYRIVTEFLKKSADPNLLVISDRPGQFTVLNYGAVDFNFANEKAADLMNEYKRHLFKEMYVIQEIEYETGQPTKETFLVADYPLTSVYELQNKAESFIRISKVGK